MAGRMPNGRPMDDQAPDNDEDEQDPEEQEQDGEQPEEGDDQNQDQDPNAQGEDGEAPDPDEDEEAEEAARIALAEQAMRGNKVSKANETPAADTAQPEVLYTEYDGNQFLADLKEALVPAIRDEVRKALETDLKTLRARTAGMRKSLDEMQSQIAEHAVQSESILKALGQVEDKEKLSKALNQAAAEAAPATKDPVSTEGAQVLEKANVEAPGTKVQANGMTPDEAKAGAAVVQKAMSLVTEYGVPVPGLSTSVIQDLNRGALTKAQIAAISEGVAKVEAQFAA